MTKKHSSRRWQELLRRIDALDDAPNNDLLRGLLGSVVKLFEGDAERRDLKMAHLALRESHRALAVFGEYRRVPKIAVFGSARTNPAALSYQMAEKFSREIVDHGFMVMTGAGGGIMAAAQAGAGARHSFGLNIDLPFEQRANKTIDGDKKLIDFRFFFTRKLFFLKETRALALFPGGFGTMDEGFEALTLIQTGKAIPMPIVLMESEGSSYWEEWKAYISDHLLARGLISEEDLNLFSIHHTVQSAVDEVTRFFRIFHSAHRNREGMSLWLWRRLLPREIEQLEAAFSDLIVGGRLTQFESGKDAIVGMGGEPLSCLDIPMNLRSQGRLRQFINALNSL